MAPEVDVERFGEALLYALEAHEGQQRKGTETPYIGHVLGVCALVLEDGGGEDEAIAGLLHDAAEDAGGRARLEEIEERFGPGVAAIVEACSDTLETPKPPWRERKEAYVAAAEHHPPEVLRVSLADKLYNVRTIVRDYRQLGETLWSRFSAYREDVFWYYGSLLAVYRRRLPESPMVAELEHAFAELQELAGAGTATA
jgi:(p)ppGpp synthase/HD superfamily hydrolase